MSKTIIVQNQWSEAPEDAIGNIILSDKAIKLIESNPDRLSFGISFTGKPQEDGTYIDYELIGVSLINKDPCDYMKKYKKR